MCEKAYHFPHRNHSKYDKEGVLAHQEVTEYNQSDAMRGMTNPLQTCPQMCIHILNLIMASLKLLFPISMFHMKGFARLHEPFCSLECTDIPFAANSTPYHLLTQSFWT